MCGKNGVKAWAERRSRRDGGVSGRMTSAVAWLTAASQMSRGPVGGGQCETAMAAQTVAEKPSGVTSLGGLGVA